MTASPRVRSCRDLLDGAVVIAEGELTGHRHIIYDRVTMFRDDCLAHDIPPELYVGHIRVEDTTALLRHQEHAPIALTRGTYRVRRQENSSRGMRGLSPTEHASLSGRHLRLLEEHCDRWAKIRLSTAPSDRDAAEEAIAIAYVVAGYPPPQQIEWCGGPVEIARQWTRGPKAVPAGANLKVAIVDRDSARG